MPERTRSKVRQNHQGWISRGPQDYECSVKWCTGATFRITAKTNLTNGGVATEDPDVAWVDKQANHNNKLWFLCAEHWEEWITGSIKTLSGNNALIDLRKLEEIVRSI